MTKVVWKYPVPLGPSLSFKMPRGAEVLDVARQHGDVQLWALVDPGEEMETRTFMWLGTGHVTDVPVTRHAGTIMVDDGAFVFHLFEVPA